MVLRLPHRGEPLECAPSLQQAQAPAPSGPTAGSRDPTQQVFHFAPLVLGDPGAGLGKGVPEDLGSEPGGHHQVPRPGTVPEAVTHGGKAGMPVVQVQRGGKRGFQAQGPPWPPGPPPASPNSLPFRGQRKDASLRRRHLGEAPEDLGGLAQSCINQRWQRDGPRKSLLCWVLGTLLSILVVGQSGPLLSGVL